MTTALIQTYYEPKSWFSGLDLRKNEVVGKLEAHDRDLLHLSAHLLILNQKGEVLCRKRKVDDFRYADLWTSSIGTHVLLGDTYQSTLEKFLPLEKKIKFVAEFRVHDKWENEVNGLYLMRAEQKDLSRDFLKDKVFFDQDQLAKLINQNRTTPHLKGALLLLPNF